MDRLRSLNDSPPTKLPGIHRQGCWFDLVSGNDLHRGGRFFRERLIEFGSHFVRVGVVVKPPRFGCGAEK